MAGGFNLVENPDAQRGGKYDDFMNQNCKSEKMKRIIFLCFGLFRFSAVFGQPK